MNTTTALHAVTILFLGVAVFFSVKSLLILRRMKRDSDSDSDSEPASNDVFPWHITHARNDLQFNFYGTYKEALAELRDRVPGALVVYVDPDIFVIFFREPAAK